MALEEESQKLSNRIEEQEQLKQQAEQASSRFPDVTNQHTVKYEVNETMSPKQFEQFTNKLQEKGLSFTNEAGQNVLPTPTH